jgi:acetyltransferase
MNHDTCKSRLAERALMPGTAPRLRLVPRNADGRARDTGDCDCGVLAAQLAALGDDIRASRLVSARAGTGLRAAARPRAINGSLHGRPVQLDADTRILIRPVEPADAALLRDVFERLGSLSRLRRFLAPVERLTPHQLEYLADVDHRSHEALIALEPRTGEAVGVARYTRERADGDSADAAVVVADVWQGRGIGTALLYELAGRASDNGFRSLSTTILTGNDAGHRLIASMPVAVRERRVAGATRVTAELPPRPA